MSEHRRPRSSSPLDGLAAVEQSRLRSRIAATLFGGEAQPLRIGPYTVLHRLGEGGLGIVYSAYDPTLDRKIAIKLLRAPDAASAPSLREEAQALAKLSHPNIVQVFEVGEHADQVFIAMEFLPGETLAHLQRDPKRPLEEQLGPWIQAAKGLLAMHNQGLVHRDFKPDNVMLLPDSGAKLFDFGLSYDAQKGQGRPSHGGTPTFIAPEQRARLAVDARADQFSFCVALWIFCTGHPPRQGDLDSQQPKKSSEMPAWIYKILEQGLRLDPKERHPSMGSIIEALQAQQQKRAKSRAWLLLGLLCAASLVSVWAVLALHQRPDPCASVQERWDTLRSGIQEDATQSASALLTQNHQRLLTYIQDAQEAHGGGCREAAQHPESAQAHFAAQSACYFAAAHAIDTVRAQLALAQGDPRILMRWLNAPLPSLPACARRSEDPAQSPELREQIETQLVRAQIQLALRNYPKAEALATQVLKACPPEGLIDLQAKALLIRARALNVSSQLTRAQEDLDKAYRYAETRNDDNLRLEALVLRVKNFSLQGKYARAEAQMQDAYPLARRAEVAVERRLEYFAKACRIDRRSASVCQAMARCQEGLALLAQGQSSPIALNKMKRRLAWTYYEAGQLAKAQRLARSADKDLRRALGTEQDSIVTMHGDALVFLLDWHAQRTASPRNPNWPALAQRAHTLYQRHIDAYGEQSPYVTTMRLHYAGMLRLSGKLDQAKEHFQALLVQMAKRGERYYALTKLGQIFIAQGQRRQGIRFLEQAIAVIQEINAGQKTNAIPELGTAHFALAQSLGAGRQAIAHAQKALAVFEALETGAQAHALDCSGDSPAIPLYAHERQAVRQWLHSQKAQPAPNQNSLARR